MKKKAVVLAASAAVVITLLGLRGCSDSAYNRFLESLYQRAQAEHRAEISRRLARVARLEAEQQAAADAYLKRIDEIAASADRRVAAASWRSNEELRKTRASAGEILEEKGKVEAALGEMTLCRDQLVVAAHAREKQIFDERRAMKSEYAALLEEKDAQLAACEKARQAALKSSTRRTWIAIGPGGAIYWGDNQVRTAPALCIQIPIVEIKSPFKRF